MCFGHIMMLSSDHHVFSPLQTPLQLVSSMLIGCFEVMFALKVLEHVLVAFVPFSPMA